MGRLLSNALVGHQGDMQGVAIDPNAFKIPDADKYRGQAEDQYKSAIERKDYVQPKQRSFLETLEQQANGQGPSLAAEQLKSAQNRNLGQQIAAAQAMRTNPGLAQREMFKNQMQGGATLAGQSAQARIQEQLNARQMYGTQLNQMSGQADQLTQQYLAQGFSMAQAQQQAAADFQRLSVQQALGLADVNSKIQTANHAQDVSAMNNQVEDIQKFATMGAMGGGGGGGSAPSGGGGSYLGGSQMSSSMGNSQFMGGGSSAMMFSDKELKTDIKDASKDISKFLDKISEHSYEYKDPTGPFKAPGKRYGFMAQDLEKSEAGKSIVKDTPQGKLVDTTQGFGLVLAAQAQLNRRLKKIETKKG